MREEVALKISLPESRVQVCIKKIYVTMSFDWNHKKNTYSPSTVKASTENCANVSKTFFKWNQLIMKKFY